MASQNNDMEKKDRVGQYLTPHLKELIFDELSDAYLERAGIADILKGVPIPIRKNDMGNITTLTIARSMAFVIGCDPSFEYAQNYVSYILRTFDKKFAEGLIADGVEGAAKNDFDYACIQFRAAMMVDPDNANAYYCYGRACKDAYELGEDEEFVGRFKAEALESFEIATLKNPKLAEAFYFLGYAYLNMGLYVKARLTWMEYMKLTEDDSTEGIDELRKDVKSRLDALEKPVEIEKGYNLILSGKYIEGIEILSKYRESEFSAWWPLWYYLGSAYNGLEDYDEALSCFKEVLKYSPSNTDAMGELVKLYEMAGETEMVEKYKNKIAIVEENIKKDKVELNRSAYNNQNTKMC